MKKNIKKILTTSLIASFALTTALGVGVFAMPKAESDFSDFTMDTGAGVKMDEATGIRFTANVGEKTQASLENATDIVFGTLIAPTLGSDNQLTLDDVTDANVKAKNLVTAVWTDGAESYADSDTKKYNGAIVGDAEHVYPEEDYVTVLNAVGYVTYTIDNATYTEYTVNTANRSLAQAVANSVANGVEDTSGFLEKVLGLTGVDIEKESVDMVVGGKETIATSTYTQAGIVWDSTDKNVATVENGVITAVGKGTATVSVTLGDYTDSISVNVGDYVVGSMMMVRQTNATYDLVTDNINGHTGVYKYTDTTVSDWNDRLAVYESAHPVGVSNSAIPYVNSVEAFNNMVTKNYKYVTFDVSFTNGAELKVESMSGATQSSNQSRMDYKNNATLLSTKTAITNNAREVNECISLWANGVEIGENEKVYHTKWYTVVIDRENCKVPTSSSVWSAINFAGSSGTIYFDNVRYYGNKTDCMADVAFADTSNANYVGYDGSQLVWGLHTNEGATYQKTSSAIGTTDARTNVYEYKTVGNGWGDKIMLYESGHNLQSSTAHLQTEFSFPDATSAFNNIRDKGYTYATVDICFSSGALIRVTSVDSSKAYTQNNYQAGVAFGGSVNKNDCISLYYQDENSNWIKLEVGETVQAGIWYRMCFKREGVVYDSTWSAMAIVGYGTTYYDDVRYWKVNPFDTVA